MFVARQKDDVLNFLSHDKLEQVTQIAWIRFPPIAFGHAARALVQHSETPRQNNRRRNDKFHLIRVLLQPFFQAGHLCTGKHGLSVRITRSAVRPL